MKKMIQRYGRSAWFIALCFVMVLSMCACGGKEPEPETTDPIVTTQAPPETTLPPETTDPGPKEMSSADIAAMAGPATATVHTDTGLGTGFFVDDEGTLITCYHVIDGATEISVEMSDGGVYQIDSIIDFNELYDVAVLDVSITGNAYLDVCEDGATQGETVYALGSSRGLDGTFSNGVISAVNRKVGAITCVQTTAATSGGNSGGPLMNVYGQVVGINALTRTDGQNLNYAIDMSMLDKLSMDKYWDISNYQEWYDKEIKRSYLVYDWNEEYWERSKIHTYQNITGAECLFSTDGWALYANGETEVLEAGYVDTYGIYLYEYSESEVDQYTEYLKSIGFTYYGVEEYRDWAYPGTSFYYLNEFTGVSADIYVFEDESGVVVEVCRQ